MNLENFKPTMHNDLSIEDESIFKQHSELIKNNNYVDAVGLLNDNKQITACTATLFNSWEQKIKTLDEISSSTAINIPWILSEIEPQPNQMSGKLWWKQKY